MRLLLPAKHFLGVGKIEEINLHTMKSFRAVNVQEKFLTVTLKCGDIGGSSHM